MTLRRYNDPHDDLASIDRLFDQFSLGWPFHSSTSYRGRFVNEDEYDIIPKRSTIERKLREAEERLSRQENHKKLTIESHDRVIESTRKEIDELKKKLSP